MNRRLAQGLCIGAAGIAFLAGCGGADSSGQSGAAASSAARSSTAASQERAAPERVVVCEPGKVDTAASVDDVPAWPGPPPSEFMTPHPPSGACGTLTGAQAREVYDAALGHPAALLDEGRVDAGGDWSDTTDALWSMGSEIVWLVVEPQW